MSAKWLVFLIRSNQVASEQLQEILTRLIETIQATFSENVSGRIHVLPAKRSLDWFDFPPESITADIVTAASFGKRFDKRKIPRISDPTIVIEIHLMPIESDMILEEASLTAEFLIEDLKGILAIFELEIQETRLARLCLSPTDEDINRNEAFRAVLERENLDIFSDPLLWQNEDFISNLEQLIQAELKRDPGGIRRFLADFESRIEDLDARWLLRLYQQVSGTRGLDFGPLIREYQDIYTCDFLQHLESMQNIASVDLQTHRRLSLWRQVAEREIVDSTLASQRTELRKDITNHRFQHHNREYTTSQITTRILREDQNRKLRQEAWNDLVQFSQRIAPKMRKSMVKNNTYWQERGYKNGNEPRLLGLGVSEETTRDIITSIEKRTRSTAQSLVKEFEEFLGHKVAPWDWRYAATQLPFSFDQRFNILDEITCLRKTYAILGIDIEQLPFHFTGTSAIYGVSCNAVRIPNDIIFSYGTLNGARDYFTLLYVLGKACYYAHIDGNLPYVFRRYAPQVVGKGFATLSSWLLWENGWLEEFTNLTSEEIREFSQQMKNYELLKLRYYSALALFEMDAYETLVEDPEIDLNLLYKERMESCLFMPISDSSVWAADAWLIDPQSRPLFTNYVLGQAVAATIFDYLQKEGANLFSKNFGRLFHSGLVRQGASTPWLDRLQQLTARALTPFPMSWSHTK